MMMFQIKLNLNVFVSYGMTETCSGISGFWIQDYPSKLSSSGKHFDGVNIHIVDNHIIIDCKMNMREYYMEEKLKNNSFITSDLGRMNDGFLYIEGRDRDTVISGGEKINKSFWRKYFFI